MGIISPGVAPLGKITVPVDPGLALLVDSACIRPFTGLRVAKMCQEKWYLLSSPLSLLEARNTCSLLWWHLGP